MEKIRTMIADDDHLVRSYLKMLTAWDRAGYEIAADVRDGEEALEVLQKEACELLVTDLSMPLMDGIELIKRIRKTNREIYIIVLSCHDEFTYVKEAMKEGADEYVLKNTLDEDSLYELLNNTRDKIEEKRQSARQTQNEIPYTGERNPLAKYRFFNGLIAGMLNEPERENARIQAGVTGRYKNSAVITLFLEEWEEQEETDPFLAMEQYCQEFAVRLQSEMEKRFDRDGANVEVVYLGKGFFCSFLDLTDVHKSSQMYQRLTTTATTLLQICQQEQFRYCIGVSNVCIGAEAIRQAYQQSREMIKLRFYDDSEILYYDENRKASGGLPKEAEAWLEEAKRYVQRNDREGFHKKCEAVTEAFREERTESRLVIQWMKQLEQRIGVLREPNDRRVYRIGQVEAFLQRCEKELFEKQPDAAVIPKDVNPAVKAAAEYVLRHYREPIGLSDAAEAAGVNATYLSYLFQKEMSVGFSNFLLARRMECAKDLLSQTSLKIREVAEQSGFNDYHYFAKTFKKMFDVSPAEYRKKTEN